VPGVVRKEPLHSVLAVDDRRTGDQSAKQLFTWSRQSLIDCINQRRNGASFAECMPVVIADYDDDDDDASNKIDRNFSVLLRDAMLQR